MQIYVPFKALMPKILTKLFLSKAHRELFIQVFLNFLVGKSFHESFSVFFAL